MILSWILLFIVSLVVLIKSADYFTKGAEIFGLRLKIPAFIVGVTIVSVGTSLPELVTSLIAITHNQATIVVANVIGSNIANILLIVGIAAVWVGTLKIERSLIDLDAPLLAISTAVLLSTVWDKRVTPLEGIFLLLTYVVYVLYTTLAGKGDEDLEHKQKIIKAQIEEGVEIKKEPKAVEISWYRIGLYIVLGVIGVYFGAEYTIYAMQQIATAIGIATPIIAITAVALGTSLPELVVSVTAARKGNHEVALGNVFGSNIFNSLVVVGLPALFGTLPVDAVTFGTGIFFLITATILYIFSGISKHVHKWEGMMFLILYALFILKIVGGGL